MKNRIKSWFTTITGMIIMSMFIVMRICDQVSDLSMWIGIAVGLVLLFFKDEWAAKLFQKLINKL